MVLDRPDMSGKTQAGPAKYQITPTYNQITFWEVSFLVSFCDHKVRNGLYHLLSGDFVLVW